MFPEVQNDFIFFKIIKCMKTLYKEEKIEERLKKTGKLYFSLFLNFLVRITIFLFLLKKKKKKPSFTKCKNLWVVSEPSSLKITEQRVLFSSSRFSKIVLQFKRKSLLFSYFISEHRAIFTFLLMVISLLMGFGGLFDCVK